MALQNPGKYPVDYTSDVGKVRSLLSDDEPTEVEGTPPNQTGAYLFYGDDAIEGLLAIYGTPERTAIYIWRMIAITPALKYKKWSSADLSVDGPAITRAIREIINDIEKGIAAADDAAAGEFFQIVDTGASVPQPAFQRDEILFNGKPIDQNLFGLI